MDSIIGSSIEERARLNAEGYQGQQREFSETIGPIIANARSLSGDSPFPWASTILNATRISIPLDSSVRTSIEVLKGNGRISISMSGAHSWAFYVECSVQLTDPAMSVRWDALMSDSGPVNGIATLDPATGRYYFATPRAERDEVHITVDAQTGSAPNDSVLVIHQIEFIGLR